MRTAKKRVFFALCKRQKRGCAARRNGKHFLEPVPCHATGQTRRVRPGKTTRTKAKSNKLSRARGEGKKKTKKINYTKEGAKNSVSPTLGREKEDLVFHLGRKKVAGMG